MTPRRLSEYPADPTPEHSKRGSIDHDSGDGPLHPDVVAAYDYVDTVMGSSDFVNPPAWYGWALREAFLAGMSAQASK